jgi:crotonobetainyl-CoA:carnitine CoA-transferase CaiB-like acyl-CoA transferase
MLGDLGAEVIKVENPNSLDESRAWPPLKDGMSCYFLAGNRNKRSITLDLAAEGGLERLHELIESANIVLENFRLDVGLRFGMDEATFRERHPRVVLGSVRGFAEGPFEGDAAYDASMQAQTGLMSLTGAKGGDAARIGVAIVDQGTALYATIGILGALRAAERDGRGSHVEVALYDSGVSLAHFQILSWTQGDTLLERTGTAHPAMVPNKVFTTGEGEILVMCGNDRQWSQLCAAMGLAEIEHDPRFETNVVRVANQDALYEILEPRFAQHTRDEWMEILKQARVACAPVNQIDEVADFLHEHSSLPTTYRGTDGREFEVLASPIRIDGRVLPVRDMPLAPGEDNDSVLGRTTNIETPAAASATSSGKDNA